MLVAKVGKHIQILHHPELRTEGYDAIVASSTPPYGPHIEKHEAEVFGVGPMKNVRVVDPVTERELKALDDKVTLIRKQVQNILGDRFLTFPLAQPKDFEVVHRGYTKEEAQAKLPTGEAAKRAVKEAKFLGKMFKGGLTEFTKDHR